jgi:tetratricopeptide (TPR) repeat protein/DNA-binding phage protein
MRDQERELLELAASPEIEALACEVVSRFTAALFSLVAPRAGNLTEVAEVAQVSASYLYRVQNGERKPSFGMIARLLVATETSFHTLLQRALELEWSGKPEAERGLTGPVPAMLADWRASGAERDSPFIGKIDRCLAKIAGLELADSGSGSEWRPTILKLERKRLREWRRLRVWLERLTLQWARNLSRQETVSRIELADLAILIAAWAAVQRVAGLCGFAIDGLARAFVLAERSDEPWAKAFCLQKAAYVSHDLGHDHFALAMIDKAAVHLTEGGNADDFSRLAIDRGYFSYYSGRIDDAERLFTFGLRKLEPCERLYRAAAHLALARIRRERGDLARARKELEAAIEIHAPASIEAAYVLWEAAEHESASQDWDRAEDHYRQALQLFAKFGTASDIAFVALDYAELLFKTRRLSEMKVLIAEVLGWLVPMAEAKHNLVWPFENLSALLTLGTLTLMELANAREQCKKACARLRAEFFVG